MSAAESGSPALPSSSQEDRTLCERQPNSPHATSTRHLGRRGLPVLRGVSWRLRRRLVRVGLWRRLLRLRLVGRLRRALHLQRVGEARCELCLRSRLGYGRSSRICAATRRAGCIGELPVPSSCAQRLGVGRRADADYGGDFRRHNRGATGQLFQHSGSDELRQLLDPGAECCVCHRDYAPQCPIEPLRSDQVPRLVTITGVAEPVAGHPLGPAWPTTTARDQRAASCYSQHDNWGERGRAPRTERRRCSRSQYYDATIMLSDSLATARDADDERPKAPPGQRVAHLRHGPLPVTEVAAKNCVRVPVATPDDGAEKHFQAELLLEACWEATQFDPSQEEYGPDLTTTRVKQERSGMENFGCPRQGQDQRLGGELQASCGSSGPRHHGTVPSGLQWLLPGDYR